MNMPASFLPSHFFILSLWSLISRRCISTLIFLIFSLSYTGNFLCWDDDAMVGWMDALHSTARHEQTAHNDSQRHGIGQVGLGGWAGEFIVHLLDGPCIWAALALLDFPLSIGW